MSYSISLENAPLSLLVLEYILGWDVIKAALSSPRQGRDQGRVLRGVRASQYHVQVKEGRLSKTEERIKNFKKRILVKSKHLQAPNPSSHHTIKSFFISFTIFWT